MKILIISHGDFAAGMCSTLRTFLGRTMFTPPALPRRAAPVI